MPLNPKQEMFCLELVKDNDRARAYMMAYTSCKSERGAEASAAKLLANPNISARIAALRCEIAEKAMVEPVFVIRGLVEVAERCLQRKPVMEFDFTQKRMVQKIDEEGNGVWEFDSSGANRAFELLGKHLGIFEKDNKQKNNEVTINVLVQS